MTSSYEQTILRWRAARQRSLVSPDGWLSLAGLFWLHEGRNRVGSDPTADVVLPGGPSTVGWIEVRGKQVSFHAENHATVTHGGEAVGSMALEDDRTGPPTRLAVGGVTFHLIDREGRLAVRVRDPESPARHSFRGLEYFPIDLRWRVEATFHRYAPSRSALAPNVLGFGETYEVPGALRFDVDGVTHQIEAFREPGQDDLFLVFGDLTNGAETYGGGRYLYTKPPRHRGRALIDFNRSYNPPCVFTPYATCVLPLPENRLPMRIEAGEKAYPPAH